MQIKPSNKIGYYEKSRQYSLGEAVEQVEPSCTAGEGAYRTAILELLEL